MNNRCLDKERRRFKRIRNECVILSKITSSGDSNVVSAGKEFNGIMLDLSLDGVSFLVNESIPENTIIASKFVLVNRLTAVHDDYLNPITIQGRVCYSLKKENKKYRLGMHFSNKPENFSNLLNKLVGKKK
jgi:hypothetical protein